MADLHRSTPAELHDRLTAERRGVPFLAFRDDTGRQHLVELSPDRPRLYIGRQPTCDVALPWDAEVSRLHADVECVGGVWTVVDDGRSRNGSYLNGERLHGRRPLRHGDVIGIGRTRLEFVSGDAQPLQSTAVAEGRPAPSVSEAQRRVLVALCRPLAGSRIAVPPSNRELAGELFLSTDTVKSHLHALFDAFGLEDVPQNRKRAELARLAVEWGVVSPAELR